MVILPELQVLLSDGPDCLAMGQVVNVEGWWFLLHNHHVAVTDACDAAVATWSIIKLSVGDVRACNGNIMQQYRRIEGDAIVMWIIFVVCS